MHAVRRGLLGAQADRPGLPLVVVEIPSPPSRETPGGSELRATRSFMASPGSRRLGRSRRPFHRNFRLGPLSAFSAWSSPVKSLGAVLPILAMSVAPMTLCLSDKGSPGETRVRKATGLNRTAAR
jgi:hypothetical protein